MEDTILPSKIFCFHPTAEKETKNRNKTVYHYTSPEGLLAILSSPSIRFTDCQFLNDRSEYNHIHIPLEAAFEEVRSSLYHTGLSELIQGFINDKYDFQELVVENPSLGHDGTKLLTMRHFVFCASTDPDLLNMWNYYVKGNKYQGYNLGISVNDIVSSLSSMTQHNSKLFYGPVIYSNKEKIDTLKKAIQVTDESLHLALESIADSEEQELMIQEKYAELVSYLENFRLFFKDASFSSEKEYRFVLRMPERQTEIPGGSLKIAYTVRQGVVTPHCDVPFRKNGVIKKITVAPMVENSLATAGLQRYLQDNGYDSNIEINESKIPIRY